MLDDADRAAILKLEADWLTAQTRGQTDDIRALLTEDCELCPPDGDPARGIDAFMKNQAPPGTLLNVRISEAEIEGGPVHAWKTARFATRIAMADGREVTVQGRHMWLLRKTGGVWKVRVLSWRFDHG
jgi:ketosteroid isomerase-like protein